MFGKISNKRKSNKLYFTLTAVQCYDLIILSKEAISCEQSQWAYVLFFKKDVQLMYSKNI